MESIEIDPKRLSGKPTLKGTRISVAQILAQISEGDSIEDIAEDMSLDIEKLRKLFEELSREFNCVAKLSMQDGFEKQTGH